MSRKLRTSFTWPWAALLFCFTPTYGVELFTELPPEAGLDFVHFNGMSGQLYFPEMMGAGGAFLDYDNDGDLDIYFLQGHMLGGRPATKAVFPPPQRAGDRLYRNDSKKQADGRIELRFTDVTDAAGIVAQGYGMGVAAGDVNNDGWVDLYITNLHDNQLWLNQGNGRFRDATASAGVNDSRWSVSASFVDFDGDGWLDLYVGNYVQFDMDNPKPCRNVTSAPDYCGPQVFKPYADRLLRNLGAGRFADVSQSAGITYTIGSALGVIAADFNGDGRPDIYVANDGLPNILWINNGKGGFTDEALLAGVAVNRDGRAEASMGVDAADFDGDGDIDLFMTHLIRETNTLYVNDGKGWFEERTARAGLSQPSVPYTGFGTAWFDYDNDGWLDLLIVNGGVTFYERLQLEQTNDPYPLDRPNQLFANHGGKSFSDISAAAGAAFQRSDVSRGAAFGDVDNDGDVDVLITNNSGPARLLINQRGQRAAWLGVRVITGKRDALGARVVLLTPDKPSLWRTVRSDGSYASAGDPRVIFGLGADRQPRAVQVYWPDGTTEQYPELATGRYHTLRRGLGQPVAGAQ